MRTLLAILLVFGSLTAEAATILVNADTLPIEKAFSNACVAASAGDTIIITNGTFGWTNSYTTPTKRLTIRGVGTDSTKLIFRPASISTVPLIFNSLTVANMQEFGYMTLDGDGRQRQNGMIIATGHQNGPASYRIHHCVFTNSDISGSRAMNAEYSGLVDQNTFVNVYSGVSIFGQSFGAWTNKPNVIGTATNCFIENNRFLFTAVGNGPQDAYDGACFVFRYNYCSETVGGTHGFDSGSYASPRNYEFYNNVWTNTGANLANPLQFRGGTGYIYNEKFYGYNFGPTLDNYRSCIAGHTSTGWGPCSGTNVYDGNTPGGFGYPCYQQIGRTANMVLFPTAMWNCTLGGSLTTMGPPTYTCTTNDPPGDGPGLGPHIILGRDATNLLSAPVSYTPYQYPHPLNTDPSVGPAITLGPGTTLGNGITVK